MIDAAVQFTEGGEGCRAHPDDEVFVLVAVVVGVFEVELPHRLGPVHWLNGVLERCSPRERNIMVRQQMGVVLLQ